MIAAGGAGSSTSPRRGRSGRPQQRRVLPRQAVIGLTRALAVDHAPRHPRQRIAPGRSKPNDRQVLADAPIPGPPAPRGGAPLDGAWAAGEVGGHRVPAGDEDRFANGAESSWPAAARLSKGACLARSHRWRSPTFAQTSRERAGSDARTPTPIPAVRDRRHRRGRPRRPRAEFTIGVETTVVAAVGALRPRVLGWERERITRTWPASGGT